MTQKLAIISILQVENVEKKLFIAGITLARVKVKTRVGVRTSTNARARAKASHRRKDWEQPRTFYVSYHSNLRTM